MNESSISAPKVKRRARVVWIGVLTAFAVCGFQLFNIQIVKGAELAEQGKAVRTSIDKIDAPRGEIVDANGQVLAETIKTYHIAVNQKNITEYRHYEDGKLVGTGAAEAAKQLAPVLGMDASELGGKLVGDQDWVYLAKNVDVEKWREVRKLRIYGIDWEPSFERLYPAGITAASVVGSVDADGVGNSGLELTYDKLLTGVPGEESFEVGPTGAEIPGGKRLTKEAVPGATLNTSIDSDLNYSLQDLVTEYTKRFGADWGAVVVMEMGTGRILALADSDLVSPEKGPQNSPAVQSMYEPGSVGKVLTFATALQEGTINPLTMFSVPSVLEVGGQTFQDFHEDHPTYQKTATGVLAMSSNTGTIQVGSTVSDESRYKTFKDFGLGQPTGIELPAESAGSLTDPSKWDGRTRYTTMFGQGLAVNAIQATAIVATVGNSGVWVAPHLVDGWTEADGTFHPKKAEAPREVLKPDVASTLLTMMESVVANEDGTASLAAVPGYRIAAKTGTAERLGLGGIVPSMSGVIPADNPKIAVTAVLYNPQASDAVSSVSVAPLFGSVVTEAVRMLGIPPSSEPAKLFPSE